MRASKTFVKEQILEIERLQKRLDGVHTRPTILTIIRTLATLYENTHFALVSVDGELFCAFSHPNDGRGIVFDCDTNRAEMILNRAVEFDGEQLIFYDKKLESKAIGQRVADSDLRSIAAFGYSACGYTDPSEQHSVWRKTQKSISINSIVKMKILLPSTKDCNEIFKELPIDTNKKKDWLEFTWRNIVEEKKCFLLSLHTK